MQITARDNMEAYATLEAQGLTRIRLQEAEPASGTPSLSELRRARAGAESVDATVTDSPDTWPTPTRANRLQVDKSGESLVVRKPNEPLVTRQMPGVSEPNEPLVTQQMPAAKNPDRPAESVPRRTVSARTTREMPAEPRTRGLAVVDEPLERSEPARPRADEEPPSIWKPRPHKPVDPRKRAMPAVDRMNFFSSLSAMLSAGIPLMRGVRSLQEQYSDPVSAATMTHLATTVAQGKSLSTAMAGLPLTFSKLQVGSVRGAENAGNLPSVLGRLHRYDERTLSLRREVQSHMSYPIMVFGCALVLILFVGRFLLTGMLPVLEQARVKINFTTSVAISIARALEHPLVLLLCVAAVAAGVWQLMRWLKTQRGALIRDRFLMEAPLLRGPLRKVETVRACESLATLYGSGMTILQCLEAVQSSSDNTVVRMALASVVEDVREGRSLAQSLQRTGFFDKTVVQLVYVGEETGNLDMAFTKIAQYNDLEVRTALDQFTAAIEPVMMVILGVTVGIIALMAFAPLFQVLQTL